MKTCNTTVLLSDLLLMLNNTQGQICIHAIVTPNYGSPLQNNAYSL